MVMRTAVLTGASGFVGSHTAARLLSEGWAVRALLREGSSTTRLPEGCEVVRVDFMDESGIEPHLAGAEALIHIAGSVKARSQEEFDRANALITRKLVAARDLAAPGCRFILVSSQAAAGPEGACGPVTAYGRSKLLGERTLRGSRNWVIVRPPAVFGPGDDASTPMFRMASRGLLVTPWTRGRFAMIYVADLAVLLVVLAASGAAEGETLEPSYGVGYTWREFHAVLQRAANRRILHLRVPSALVVAAAFTSELASSVAGTCPFFTRDKCRELLAASWEVEERRTTELTGWVPSIPLEDALRLTLQGAGVGCKFPSASRRDG
jgi:2-alkyl-3-oxoalkanoate reductase